MASSESSCVFTSYQRHTVFYTVPPPFLGEGDRGRGNVFPKNDNPCGQQGE